MSFFFFFFFFNDTATTEIYTLSLHDALPILTGMAYLRAAEHNFAEALTWAQRARRINPYNSGVYGALGEDRKSTRLNSSHSSISYAVFCLKKKTTKNTM